MNRRLTPVWRCGWFYRTMLTYAIVPFIASFAVPIDGRFLLGVATGLPIIWGLGFVAVMPLLAHESAANLPLSRKLWIVVAFPEGVEVVNSSRES